MRAVLQVQCAGGPHPGDGPQVAVLDEVSADVTQHPVVVTGHHDIADAGRRAIAQPHPVRRDRLVGDPPQPGALVQVGDVLVRRGDHDRVLARGDVLGPGGVQVLQRGLERAGVHAAWSM